MIGNRWGRSGRLVASLALLAIGCVGCTPDQADSVDDRDVAVYRTVIEDLASRYPVETEDPETVPTLFVETFEPASIPLVVQVELVASFEEMFEIRFIDDRIEAVDSDLPETPVRIESILVGIGPVTGDRTVEVRAELYVSESDIRAYRYSLEEKATGRWSMSERPEEIDPEGFGASP